MERFSRRENVLLGYSPERSVDSSPHRKSDMDFNDVFGGPPRRYSIHEVKMRYSFSEAVLRPEEEEEENEKPVFGAETMNRRRYQKDDFFDDIFSSTPGSRNLSPSRPFQPNPEPFATSLPAQFSLPAQLTKARESDTLASTSSNRIPYKKNNGVSNLSPNAALSRSSSQEIEGNDNNRDDIYPIYRQSPLSHQNNSEDSSYKAKSNETERGNSKNSGSLEASDNSLQFHFSIYKWAGKGVPLMMPLRGRRSSKKNAGSKHESCSTRRSENDRIVVGLPVAVNQSALLKAEIQSLTVDGDKQIKGSNARDNNDTQRIARKSDLDIPESKVLSSTKDFAQLDRPILSDKSRENLSSVVEGDLHEKNEKEASSTTHEELKVELKTLHKLPDNDVKGKDSSDSNHKTENKRGTTKVKPAANASTNVSQNVNKLDGKRKNIDIGKLNNANLYKQHSSSEDAIKKGGVKGKVKEFVKIFNQDIPNTTTGTESRSQSSRWKEVNYVGSGGDANLSTDQPKNKVHGPKVDKMQETKMDEDPNKSDKGRRHSHTRNFPSSYSADRKDASSIPESHPKDAKFSVGSADELFEESFVVEELFDNQDEATKTLADSRNIQGLDAKIQQWSQGKKGNIRSLFSTLQYVLWPDSGWKPVALVDLIEGSSVKKAYQRALLCLHPDKLQQKGAASHQKYIAEKVFDILQEAWDQFNSLGSL